MLLLCGLPIAGLTALGIWGVGEFTDRLDAIGAAADDFMLDASSGDEAAIAAHADGGAGCADGPALASTVESLNLAGSTFLGGDVRFVDRSENGDISFGPNADELEVVGREQDSTAVVFGELADGRNVQITLLMPSDAWRVCGLLVE